MKRLFVWSVVMFGVLTQTGAAQNPRPPNFEGDWIITGVLFPDSTMPPALMPTPSAKQALLNRIGQTIRVSPNCPASNLKPVYEAKFVPQQELIQSDRFAIARMRGLGLAKPGVGAWIITRLCGNSLAGIFFLIPNQHRIIGGHDPNDPADYEFVLGTKPK